MTNWYTADTHFGHENVIRFCKSPEPDILGGSFTYEESLRIWFPCLGRRFGKTGRARRPQISQATGVLCRASGFEAMSGA